MGKDRRIIARDRFGLERERAGYTQAALAKKAAISISHMNNIERQVVGVSPPVAKRISDGLGVEFDKLFKFQERGGFFGGWRDIEED